jgi:hypothetical protein
MDTDTVSRAVAPRLSVAVNVMVCTSGEREGASTLSPSPIRPSVLDSHTRLFPVKTPVSGSSADPSKSIVSVRANSAPPAGEVIVTDGGWLESSLIPLPPLSHATKNPAIATTRAVRKQKWNMGRVA